MDSLTLQRAVPVIASYGSSPSPSPSPSTAALSSSFKQRLLLPATASGRRGRRDRAVCTVLSTGEIAFSSASYRGFPRSSRGPANRGSVHLQRGRGRQAYEWKDGATKGRGIVRRADSIVTNALPVDTYWITAVQAMSVAGLMAGIAVVTGILINIRLEVLALEEYHDLEKKGLLPDEILIPDEDFDVEAPLYVFKTKDLDSSSSPPRNRPVREELEPELEIASKE